MSEWAKGWLIGINDACKKNTFWRHPVITCTSYPGCLVHKYIFQHQSAQIQTYGQFLTYLYMINCDLLFLYVEHLYETSIIIYLHTIELITKAFYFVFWWWCGTGSRLCLCTVFELVTKPFKGMHYKLCAWTNLDNKNFNLAFKILL